jgi:hypothetical protein
VSLQIDSQRSSAARAIAHLGGGPEGALLLLADQVSKLVDELTRIGAQSAQPVGARNPAVPSARGLAAMSETVSIRSGDTNASAARTEALAPTASGRARDTRSGITFSPTAPCTPLGIFWSGLARMSARRSCRGSS